MPSEEIFYLPVTELAKRIQSKKISPVELTQLYLARSEKLGPEFNAYARLTPDLALEQATEGYERMLSGKVRFRAVLTTGN